MLVDTSLGASLVDKPLRLSTLLSFPETASMAKAKARSKKPKAKSQKPKAKKKKKQAPVLRFCTFLFFFFPTARAERRGWPENCAAVHIQRPGNSATKERPAQQHKGRPCKVAVVWLSATCTSRQLERKRERERGWRIEMRNGTGEGRLVWLQAVISSCKVLFCLTGRPMDTIYTDTCTTMPPLQGRSCERR